MSKDEASGPYGGFETLEEAIEGLRRARFKVLRAFEIQHRGLVVEGDVVEGSVSAGMILLPVHERHDNVYIALTIEAVEHVKHQTGHEHVGLVLTRSPHEEPNFSEGTVVDVLSRSPAA